MTALSRYMRSIPTQPGAQGSATTLDGSFPALSPSHILQLVLAIRFALRSTFISTFPLTDLRHQLRDPGSKQYTRSLQHEHVGTPHPTSSPDSPASQRTIEWDPASISPMVCTLPRQPSLPVRERKRTLHSCLPRQRLDDAQLDSHLLRLRHCTTICRLARRGHERSHGCLYVCPRDVHTRCQAVSITAQSAR
jgi:hypothetical protein